MYEKKRKRTSLPIEQDLLDRVRRSALCRYSPSAKQAACCDCDCVSKRSRQYLSVARGARWLELQGALYDLRGAGQESDVLLSSSSKVASSIIAVLHIPAPPFLCNGLDAGNALL